jgi:hypothetical protein
MEALVFAVHDCGYVARSALEFSDGSQARISKIYQLIGKCRFGIHDISNTDLDTLNGMPRFNMPLELGLFLGAKRYGGPPYRQKRCLVLVKQSNLHQIYCSDIAGQDVYAHAGENAQAIKHVRNWLRTQSRKHLPGAAHIIARYATFRSALPTLCHEFQLEPDELTFNDLSTLVAEWLRITG